MSKQYYVQIRSPRPDDGLRELLRIVERNLPVTCLSAIDEQVTVAGELVVAAKAGAVDPASNSHLARLTVPESPVSPVEVALAELKVQFADDAEVPFPFQGRCVTSQAVAPTNYLQCGPDEKVLASSEKGHLWVVSTGSEPKRYRSALALPVLAPDGMFQNVFNGDRFIELLPLIHFLRAVCGKDMLEGPPLRACFIFDDPNLHWSRYGYVDFQQIAARATTENYHVSFATIPLDAWFTHEPTARLFRNHPERLSLCVHGNNHTREELAANYSQPARVSLLNQAIHRVERLERNAGVRVCRVMVPPHGACSEKMLAELPGCGFEAACISHGSLRAYNKAEPWTRELGMAPAELIAGCPVLPRWAMTGNAKNTILLAAFLRQPMILRGHHQDLKPGVGVLDQLAGFINSLGPVSWSNLTDLSRANYLWRMDGPTLRLKPLGRKLKVLLPKEATRLVFEDFPAQSEGQRRVLNLGGKSLGTVSSETVELPAGLGDALSVETVVEPTPNTNGVGSLNPRAFVRRLLTEGRDRFLVLR